MSRLLLRAIILAAAIVATPAYALATSITIDFEGLNDGDAVTNQFSTLGATFSDATVLAAGVSLNEIDFPPHSGTHVVFDDGGPIAISFSAPVLSFGGFFTYGTRLTMTAFDAAAVALGSVQSAFDSNIASDPGSVPNEFLILTIPAGISSVTIAGDAAGGSFVLDDATITAFGSTTSVPEPGTLWLIAAGAAAVMKRTRRR